MKTLRFTFDKKNSFCYESFPIIGLDIDDLKPENITLLIKDECDETEKEAYALLFKVFLHTDISISQTITFDYHFIHNKTKNIIFIKGLKIGSMEIARLYKDVNTIFRIENIQFIIFDTVRQLSCMQKYDNIRNLIGICTLAEWYCSVFPKKLMPINVPYPILLDISKTVKTCRKLIATVKDKNTEKFNKDNDSNKTTTWNGYTKRVYDNVQISFDETIFFKITPQRQFLYTSDKSLLHLYAADGTFINKINVPKGGITVDKILLKAGCLFCFADVKPLYNERCTDNNLKKVDAKLDPFLNNSSCHSALGCKGYVFDDFFPDGYKLLSSHGKTILYSGHKDGFMNYVEKALLIKKSIEEGSFFFDKTLELSFNQQIYLKRILFEEVQCV